MNKKSVSYITDTKFLLDTTCTVSLYDKKDQSILSGALKLCAYYNNLFSMTVKGSDVYNINHADGKPVKVKQDTIDVIRAGIAYGKESGGLFDISVGALSSLWNFDAKSPKVPPQAKIQAALKTIGYQNVQIAGDTVALKKKGAMLDLGGVHRG